MNPTLRVGDEVIVTSLYFLSKLKVGDVVVFKHTTPPFILIKRIIEVKNNKFWVEGDNKKKSIDSRKFGFIDKKNIIGKVIFKL